VCPGSCLSRIRVVGTTMRHRASEAKPGLGAGMQLTRSRCSSVSRSSPCSVTSRSPEGASPDQPFICPASSAQAEAHATAIVQWAMVIKCKMVHVTVQIQHAQLCVLMATASFSIPGVQQTLSPCSLIWKGRLEVADLQLVQRGGQRRDAAPVKLRVPRRRPQLQRSAVTFSLYVHNLPSHVPVAGMGSARWLHDTRICSKSSTKPSTVVEPDTCTGLNKLWLVSDLRMLDVHGLAQYVCIAIMYLWPARNGS
jgi:hypothetical protein